ncbi:Hypothetical protein NTJ_09902 [Nesidiocoris tenuis]|uniref:Uncharacterized protein n=1 Tax=Nesidiocoris tenuis TaxID=355587 RepID=A0ABN7AYN4_9HEMI|nr:Hypothetical protein NTJ_09902 [Nesidiocoris tenuis]
MGLPFPITFSQEDEDRLTLSLSVGRAGVLHTHFSLLSVCCLASNTTTFGPQTRLGLCSEEALGTRVTELFFEN